MLLMPIQVDELLSFWVTQDAVSRSLSRLLFDIEFRERVLSACC